MLKNIIKTLTRRDESGDSPLELAAFVITFAAWMAFMLSMPGY